MFRIYFLIITLTIFSSCEDNKSHALKADTLQTTKEDTSITNSSVYKIEQDYLKRKKHLCDRLGLYDLEKQADSFELRVWLIPSMWDPSILYILKGKDTTWTLFHYQFYTLRATNQNHYWDNPLIDSVVMESVKPQKISWQTYIKN